jgi:hypothetical protein
MSGRIYKKHAKRKKKALKDKTYFFGPPCCPEFNAFKRLNTSGSFYWGTGRHQVRRVEADFKLVEGLDWWQIQDLNKEYQLRYCIKNIGTSRWYGSGKTRYKDVYTRYRRLESRKLEHCAMIEDEVGFEKIAPDAWKGGIGHDIW